MNWKLVVVGGLVFYIVTFVCSFATGPLIHNGVLKADYQGTQEFWRPELNQDPPDMAALMPQWITTGVICSLVFALIYSWVRGCLKGPGWKKGLHFGILLSLIVICIFASLHGVFNLPVKIWLWWCVDTLILYVIAGMVLGVVGEKLAPSG